MAKENDFNKFLAGLEKEYGEETLKIPSVEVIEHPSLGFNILTGIHGIPLGRIMEFYGPEHGGKTMMALLAIASANKQGKRCAFIDLEAALDKSWAEKLGVDWSLTTYVRPPSGEKAFDIIVKLAQSKYYTLVVVDSVAAIVSEVELEKNLEDTKDRVGGYAAKIMSSGLRKLVPILSECNVGAIFINQVRDKLGVMFGETETTPGGRSLKFYSSIRIRVNKFTKKDAVYVENGIQVGHRCNIKIKKNKLGAPDSRDAEFDLYYESGIDSIAEIIDWGHTLGILKKHGNSITYKGEKETLNEFAAKLLDDSFRKVVEDEIYNNARRTSKEIVEDAEIQLEEGLE